MNRTTKRMAVFGIAVFLIGICVGIPVGYVAGPSRPPMLSAFIAHHDDFARYVTDHGPFDADAAGGPLELTRDLDRLRVMSINRKGDYLMFYYRPSWPDDATQVMAYDLNGGSNPIRRLLNLMPDCHTYHVQHVDGRWYFWSFA